MERSETVKRIHRRENAKPLSWLDLALPFSERRALLIGGDIVIGIMAALLAFWGWQWILVTWLV